MNVRFTQKDLVLPYHLSSDMKVICERYSWKENGGPHEATLSVTGLKKNMADLLFLLRNGVEIYNDEGAPLWWGYVSRVEVPQDQVSIVVDLDEMANKVAVAYTLVNLGGSSSGVRRTTNWMSDVSSVYKYGIKELLESGTDLNTVAANALANRRLNEVKVPGGYILSKSSQDQAVMLSCKGWWQSASWRYAKVSTKLALSFETIGGSAYALHDARPKLAESFTPSSNLNVQELGVYVRKAGNPGDLTVTIHSVGETFIPGGSLGSATIASGLISGSGAWLTGMLGSPLELTAGTTYFLVVSGANLDTSNYYIFNLDPAHGYGDGIALNQMNNVWSQLPEDLPFRIYVNELVETTQQIQNLLTSYCQFTGAVFVENRSGIYSESYRNGDTTTLEELEALLEVGTAQYHRLIARVNLDRSVHIWEQPEEGTELVEMRSDGKLYYRGKGPIEDSRNPVGTWINTEAVIDRGSSVGTIAGMHAYFCESAEWDKDGRITTYPANWKNPYSVRVQNG
jgi:hypothetical protein